jgi:hypothetical protein
MKKGDVLLTIVFSIIGAIFILIVGANIFSTTLNIVDDEALAVTSMRQIATAVNSAKSGDICASAEINMARNYQILAKGSLLELWAQDYDDETGAALDDPELVDSINTDTVSRIMCNYDDTPQCRNEAWGERAFESGLNINPNFDREIDQKFCVCIAGAIVNGNQDFIVSPKGFLSVTCDNPVSQYQA